MSRWGKPTKNKKRIDPRYHLNETINKKEILQEVGFESQARPGAADNIVDKAQDWWQDTAAPAISDRMDTMRDRRNLRRGGHYDAAKDMMASGDLTVGGTNNWRELSRGQRQSAGRVARARTTDFPTVSTSPVDQPGATTSTGTTQSEPWTMSTTTAADREYAEGMRQTLQPGAYQDVTGWAADTGGEWSAPQSTQSQQRQQQPQWTDQQIRQYQATGSPYAPEEGITGGAAEFNRGQDVERAIRFTEDETSARLTAAAQRKADARAQHARYLQGIDAAGGGSTSAWNVRGGTEGTPHRRGDTSVNWGGVMGGAALGAIPAMGAASTLGQGSRALQGAARATPGVTSVNAAGAPMVRGGLPSAAGTVDSVGGSLMHGDQYGNRPDWGGIGTTGLQTAAALRYGTPMGAAVGLGSELAQAGYGAAENYYSGVGQGIADQSAARFARAGIEESKNYRTIYNKLKGNNNMSGVKTTRERMVQIIKEEAEKLQSKHPELFAEIDQPPDRTGLSAGDWRGPSDPRGSGTDEFPETEAEILGDKIAHAMERAIRTVLSDHLGVHQEQAIHEKHMTDVEEDILNIAMHMRDAALGLIGEPEGVLSVEDEDEPMELYLQEQMEAPQKVEITGTEGLEELVSQLAKGIENLDVSIDYLSAAVTGDNPVEIGIGQRMAGRFHAPSRVNLPQPQGPKEEK